MSRLVIGLVLGAALSLLLPTSVTAFVVFPQSGLIYSARVGSSSSALYSSNPPPRRKARRSLQKRRRKNKKSFDGGEFSAQAASIASGSSSTGATSTQDEEVFVEIRPLISATAKEAGEDYWIDQEELKREKERKEQIRARQPGQVPDEKLWTEVLSPYKQNWIGIFSVVIVILATIVTQFPELLQSPVISIPDL